MKTIARVLLVIIISLSVYSGCDNSVTSGPNPDPSLRQLPGCIKKTGDNDSCFTYAFAENLVADFCVGGNCCPDHDRYLLTKQIISDTIIVSVTDTAGNLCHCMCNYIVHSEFTSLPLNSYLFNVIMVDSLNKELLYSVRVNRVL